jgi:hypoxanthine phosphoribosyltransferase
MISLTYAIPLSLCVMSTKVMPLYELIDRTIDYLQQARAKSALGMRTTFTERCLIMIYSQLERRAREITAGGGGAASGRLRLKVRSTLGRKYTFVRLDELVSWASEWVRSFPRDYDVIVGIPRSGLIVAAIIACKLAVPLTTPDLFSSSTSSAWAGRRYTSSAPERKPRFEKALLVDDSITTGHTMRQSFQILRSHQNDLKVHKAALIATEHSRSLLDFYYKVIPTPRIYEWNLTHAKRAKLASDLDGVICENCPPSVDSNEVLYQKWIRSAKPNVIPTFEIDAIISNRLEKYRAETERWLARYGVRYKELLLWDVQSKSDRAGRWTQRKTELLLRITPQIFWESSFEQASAIWKETKIPTLCFDEMCLFS